ncbi:MAG: hypothetical protein HQL93_10015 [Magnetococcales bacterium]|nr:hypothetical protein [Magnetococcales bacterium]
MIIDTSETEWIVRFKGKAITFRAFKDFSKLHDRFSKAQQAIIQFEMSGIQEIDSAAMGMFLQLFHMVNPEYHAIKLLNASPKIQKKLDDLLALVDTHGELNTAVISRPTESKRLFAKVLRARAMKIQHKEEMESKQPTEDPTITEKKSMLTTYLKLNALNSSFSTTRQQS